MGTEGLLERLDDEREAMHLYAHLAAIETEPARRRLFADLGAAANEQAALIEAEMRRTSADAAIPAYQPSLRVRLVAFLLRRVGPRRMLPVLAAMKVRGLSIYHGPLVPSGGHPRADETGPEDWHSTSGGSLRAAVFGANDGLVSNASLILGVAGASDDPKFVVLSGVAGLLAGAFSMAAGEWVSVKSQREMFEHQIGQEKAELALYPESEAKELALIYEARGLPRAEAERIGKALVKDPEVGLDTLAREELGLNPADLGSAWAAAISSFLAFAAGALVPLAPFLLIRGTLALRVSIGITAVALFAVGATISLFTGRGAARSGLRMLLIGGGAGALTYGLGHVLGVSIG